MRCKRRGGLRGKEEEGIVMEVREDQRVHEKSKKRSDGQMVERGS